MIEFANHFRLSEVSFEHIMNRDSINFFTHYNLDIIFSGDLELITAYYSRDNEALHTAQVQEAFDQRVIIRGIQDVSWMLGEYWQIDTSNMEEFAIFTKPGYKVGIQIGNYTMIVNGEFIPLETAPHIRNDRILVPLLAIAEATGLEVHLDGIHMVDIFTGNNS